MPLDTAEVFLCVHTNGVVWSLHHRDVDTIFEEAQLFKLLQFLQRRWREMMERFKRLGAEGIETLVLKVLRLSRSIAIEWNTISGEVKRPSGKVGDNLNDIGIQRRLGINGH